MIRALVKDVLNERAMNALAAGEWNHHQSVLDEI
jgi:hypothetical protein